MNTGFVSQPQCLSPPLILTTETHSAAMFLGRLRPANTLFPSEWHPSPEMLSMVQLGVGLRSVPWAPDWIQP
jgi:hypothetical protein